MCFEINPTGFHRILIMLLHILHFITLRKEEELGSRLGPSLNLTMLSIWYSFNFKKHFPEKFQLKHKAKVYSFEMSLYCTYCRIQFIAGLYSEVIQLMKVLI